MKQPINSKNRTAARSLALVVGAVIVIGSFRNSAVAEDLLGAFTQASNYADKNPGGGCASIPYSDLRSTCDKKQEDKDRWCTNYSCKGLNWKETEGLRDTQKQRLEQLKKDMDSLKSKKSELKDDSQIRDTENKIQETDRAIIQTEGAIENYNKDISSTKANIKERHYMGNNCRDNRNDVLHLFRDVRSRARGESAPEIIPLAKRLDGYWEQNEAAHQGYIDKVNEAISHCSSLE